MYDSANLSREQFDTIYRLFSSLDIPQTSVSGVQISSTGTTHGVEGGPLTWYLKVEFKSGHGNRAFHIDKDGTSAPIENDGSYFGSSALVR